MPLFLSAIAAVSVLNIKVTFDGKGLEPDFSKRSGDPRIEVSYDGKMDLSKFPEPVKIVFDIDDQTNSGISFMNSASQSLVNSDDFDPQKKKLPYVTGEQFTDASVGRRPHTQLTACYSSYNGKFLRSGYGFNFSNGTMIDPEIKNGSNIPPVIDPMSKHGMSSSTVSLFKAKLPSCEK